MEVHHEELSDVNRYIRKRQNSEVWEKEPQFDAIIACLERFRKIDASLKMVEVGTGMGWFPILAKLRGWNLRGLEISPQLISAAKEFGAKYGVEPDIEMGNIEETDLGENVYDVIIASSVFEHIEDWRKALKIMQRALKPGGLMFFESTNKWSLTSGEYPMPCYGWMPNWMRYRFRMMVQGPDIMKLGIDFHQFTYGGLRRAFRDAGFSASYDRAYLARPDKIGNPIKRTMLQLCKRSRLIKFPIQTFLIDVTTFVCVK